MITRRVADGCLAIAVASTVLMVWLVTTTPGFAGQSNLTVAASGVSYVMVGVLIARRRPQHRLSWVLILIGLLAATGNTAQTIVDMEVHRHGVGVRPQPLLHWYAEWFWVPWNFLQFALLPQLFPGGRPLSERWRPVLVATVVATILMTAIAMFQQELPLVRGDPPTHTVANPLGLLPIRDLDDAILLMLIPLAVLTLLGIVSLVLRYRRSDGIERHQMKVVLFAVVLVWLTFLGQGIFLDPDRESFRVLEMLIATAVPASIGIAVLRYRLYDIDRIISRTLGYAVVSMILAGIYTVTVLVLGGAIHGLTGQDSALVVAGSTLAAAAAFRPVRARVQRTVDRHFHRSRYDAQRAVDDFGDRLRSPLDREVLRADVVDLTDQVMRPARVELWLLEREGQP